MAGLNREPAQVESDQCLFARPAGWKGRYLLAMVVLAVAPVGFGAMLVPDGGGWVDAGVMLASSALNGALLLCVMVVMYRARARIESAQDELRVLACTDPLTGLGNRRQLWRALREVDGLEASGQLLLVFDLNRFKWINDTYGHTIGDRVLTAFATALRGGTRAGSDRLFRTGGDEFVVLLVGIDAEDGGGVAARIFEHFQAELRGRGVQVLITASVGIAARRPGESVLVWLQRADAIMYEAKAADRAQRAEGG